ncbi:hypothetical protein SAMN05421736_11989 [Evansella caseinilytica]|uniref:Uncharacterized protein n=1 Tax=Evansella caseinilytica TaxID=1503961 RepID=A0A1H3U9M4_9BACI|nr:hypothetical protein SAMN05421736_11989 [Evansella caseinilytica]
MYENLTLFIKKRQESYLLSQAVEKVISTACFFYVR